VQAMAFQQPVQFATVNSQHACRASLIAILLSQNFQDMSLLEILETKWQFTASGACWNRSAAVAFRSERTWRREPEALLESELFGHERGAFTGAEQRRIGKFEQVNGGTILLDEIGDMSPATQAKVLRLLQQQQFERVGGNTTIQTDVRIIAATNKNLPEMVEAGLFRRDLFYRLNVFTIQLPPLRQRLQDVPELTLAFLRTIAQQTGRTFRHITPEALAALQQHDWPGNVRELESAVKFAAAHCTGDVITPDCLPEVCRNRGAAQEPLRSVDLHPALDIAALTQQLLDAGSTNVYREVNSQVDRVLLATVLNHAGGNLQQAAELLGISRMTLRARLKHSQSDAGEKQPADEDTARHDDGARGAGIPGSA